jgi:hypothetical protein
MNTSSHLLTPLQRTFQLPPDHSFAEEDELDQRDPRSLLRNFFDKFNYWEMYWHAGDNLRAYVPHPVT